MKITGHKRNRMSYKKKLFYVITALCFISSLIFVTHNASFYERPIAKVTKTTLEHQSDVQDMHKNKDKIFNQTITARLENGSQKGQLIHLSNQYSSSGANDQKYSIGDEVFVSIDKGKPSNKNISGSIIDKKRDKQLLLIAWVFIFTLLIVGKKQGFFSIVSLMFNSVLLSFALDLYRKHPNIGLIFICGVCILIFTVISLLLVSGFHAKTYAAIAATLAGTFVSLLITYLVMLATGEKGLRYEEMQYLTRPYHTVFMAGVFIGSLGAVMDVAITMTSSVFGLYEENNGISLQALRRSGMEIGKDIMGAMTNILFFAYISGSIPMMLLYLKNDSPIGFTLSMNISLEIARALAGGIGIVLAIPASLYASIFFIKRKKASS
ncbi:MULTISPECIES: YibE/F family protein [Bacillus amyloliquefaciens group]|uniref:YibE/F family protein n=1 Tax=Bacillus amyloliquefaciens group TaxID=1938374 RepID=UPI0014598086|nr:MULTISPECIES: YibE/F family protein [Bacillus amyloliquefaciens group]MCR4364321.1 YibE/F family protein [Bacillus amyloliquefaciens]MCV3201661.1 YibE/F family protein [Bacillus velezensis]MDP1504298.1 YibE/F family protein [Bacillus velezensis]MDP1508157.1 YibE/F family protein [Bacillus velezensis]MDW0357354.1 YibE/F family protein [Bacillus velezensis]